jgi:hypothetical protein
MLAPSSRLKNLSFLPASAGFLLGLLFNPEDGCNMFFQNIRSSKLHSVATQKTIFYSHGNENNKLNINKPLSPNTTSVMKIMSPFP